MTKSMEEFDKELAKLNIRGQWQYDALLESLVGGPKPAGEAHIWRWSDIYPKLLEAGEVMPESFTARRHLAYTNPGLNTGTTGTILCGMQMVRPGETAWVHRHSINALRFGVEGDENLYTVVNGERCPMHPNDLVLTPTWNWHDHHNESGANGIWLDVLDLPVVAALNQVAFEKLGETTQPLRSSEADYIGNSVDWVRPLWRNRPTSDLPLRYPWSRVLPSLEKMSADAGSPYDGVILEYVNPENGGPTLATLSCTVQLLTPGLETRKHRHTSSAIYYVIEGHGRIIVEGEEFAWGPRDVVSIPNWAWHQIINDSSSERAILFAVSDMPMLTALGLYREEPENSVRSTALTPVPAEALGAS
ncbi:MAG: cupin [Gammaproteobacteria bacterium]|nr:MAG: cupin [Gammaproteobacteria bacterium]